MSSIAVAGDTSGVVTISAPAVAGTPTLTLPTTSGTIYVPGGALGTPASGTLTNCTGYPASALPTGSVLQVVSATSQSAQATTTSTSYVTTGFSASITPSSSSNKVLVLLSALGRNGSGGQAFYTMYRGATDLASVRSFKQLYNPSAGVLDGAIDMSILDSPSSTSSVTYTVYFKGSAGTTYFGLDNSMVSLTLMEVKG